MTRQNMNKKKTVLLFQRYLRKHILNFGIELKNFEFVRPLSLPKSKPRVHIQNIEEVFSRKKTTVLSYIRRIFGIPNVRIKFTQEDLIFTYGTLLITNRPYCVYIENGLAIFNYDSKIAKNLIARILFYILIRMKNFQKIIFMSHAAEKSFHGTLKLDLASEKIIKEKSVICYPLIKNNSDKETSRRLKDGKELKFLFAGTFYIKGGLETVCAFNRLNEDYPNTTLTIITEIDGIRHEDLSRMQSMRGVSVYDTQFSEKEMLEFFNSSDVFLLPTYRDSFGLVLIEALSASLPIISNDQLATNEMVVNGFNGFLYESHPLRDYDSQTLELYGNLYEPYVFYRTLFKLQSEGKMRDVENFIYNSMLQFVQDPKTLLEFSRNSKALYNKKFHHQLISDTIESAFSDALDING